MANPTGDAPAASERVVEAVARAIHDDWQNAGAGPKNRFWTGTCEGLPGMANTFRRHARAAIEAYQKAMREGE
jgi:hypothetical protein